MDINSQRLNVPTIVAKLSILNVCWRPGYSPETGPNKQLKKERYYTNIYKSSTATNWQNVTSNQQIANFHIRLNVTLITNKISRKSDLQNNFKTIFVYNFIIFLRSLMCLSWCRQEIWIKRLIIFITFEKNSY